MPERSAKADFDAGDWVLASVCFAHVLVYELLFFVVPGNLTAAIWGWKLAFPLVLFIVVALPQAAVLRHDKWLVAYIAAYAGFLAWLLIAAVSADGISAGALQWTKEIPRALFFVAIAVIAQRRAGAYEILCRLIVCWGVLAVFQYAMLVIVLPTIPSSLIQFDVFRLGGPFGLLGNVSSLRTFPDSGLIVPRLAGFWNEPATASAYLLASAFLSRWLAKRSGRARWKVASVTCLLGALLCLSNAGFLALGCAIAFGAAVRSLAPGARRWHLPLILLPAFALAVVAIAGRGFVVANMPDSEIARAVLGVRSVGADYDQTEGRLSLLEDALSLVRERPVGVGLRVDLQELSASAPIYWLTIAGIPGLILICIREGTCLCRAVTSGMRGQHAVERSQAWIAVLVVQLSYGQWVNPLYCTLVAGVFATFAIPLGVKAGEHANSS